MNTEPLTQQPCLGVACRPARLRWAELGLVLFVATGIPICSSSYLAIHGLPLHSTHGDFRYLFGLTLEALALLLLWYVLRRSGRTFRSLGIRVSARTFFVGLGFFGCTVAHYVSWYIAQLGHYLCFGNYATPRNVYAFIGAGELIAIVPFVLLNPIFEEMIVRGFLMTEITELSGSGVLAVLVSATVQASYHTYQGWIATTGLFINFLILSAYYARTRNLFPVIVAHAVMDCSALWYLLAISTH